MEDDHGWADGNVSSRCEWGFFVIHKVDWSKTWLFSLTGGNWGMEGHEPRHGNSWAGAFSAVPADSHSAGSLRLEKEPGTRLWRAWKGGLRSVKTMRNHHLVQGMPVLKYPSLSRIHAGWVWPSFPWGSYCLMWEIGRLVELILWAHSRDMHGVLGEPQREVSAQGKATGVFPGK